MAGIERIRAFCSQGLRESGFIDFFKTSKGLLILGVVCSILYVSLAATIGHCPDPYLPITPEYYGTYYYPWAFPLNFNPFGNCANDVARSVLLGLGEPNHDLILANLWKNLKHNIPAYLAPALIGSGSYAAKGIRKILNLTKKNA